MFGIDSFIWYTCPQCRHVILPSLTLVFISNGDNEDRTSSSTECSNLSRGSLSSGDRFSGFWGGRLVFPSYCQRLHEMKGLNSGLYKCMPVYPRQHVYYKLWVIIHFHNCQLYFLKFERKRVWWSFTCFGSAIQEVVGEQLHLESQRSYYNVISEIFQIVLNRTGLSRETDLHNVCQSLFRGDAQF